MPAESHFFGYPLRSFVAVRKDGTHQWYTAFVRLETEIGRLSHPKSLGEFKGTVVADSAKSYCQSLLLGAPRPAWAKLLSNKLYRFVEITAKKTADGMTQEEAYKLECILLELLEEMTRHFDMVLNDGKSLFLDPYVRGMMMEQALWQPQISPAPISKVIPILLEDIKRFKGDQSLTFSLLCAYAALGIAPTRTSYAYFVESGQGGELSDLDSAAVSSRWKLQTHPNHVEAVLGHLSSTKQMADRMKCVETLILMGQVTQVPKESMETWFNGIEANTAQMLRPLNLLMQTPSGRKWLADRFKAMPPSSATRDPIRALFENELSAVRKAGDYRFWAREECDLLESSLSLSTDSIGSTSR